MTDLSQLFVHVYIYNASTRKLSQSSMRIQAPVDANLDDLAALVASQVNVAPYDLTFWVVRLCSISVFIISITNQIL